MTEVTQRSLPALILGLAGKLLIAALFWWSGLLDILPRFDSVADWIGSNGVPYPRVAAGLAVAVEGLAPLALFIPRLETLAALVLAGYCLVTALIFHQFWGMGDADNSAQLINFLKNLAIAGALMLFVSKSIG